MTMDRLTPPGIAATAASLRGQCHAVTPSASRPPESRRLRPPAPSRRAATIGAASRPPESRRLRLSRVILAQSVICTASRPPESRRLRRGHRRSGITLQPPHAPRNRGDCGPAIARGEPRDLPPHAPRNRGDCGRTSHVGFRRVTMSASRPPESRRLRHRRGRATSTDAARLTPPGIAATAASRHAHVIADIKTPPHAPRNRGDCGSTVSIAERIACSSASPPPESRRLRPQST